MWESTFFNFTHLCESTKSFISFHPHQDTLQTVTLTTLCDFVQEVLCCGPDLRRFACNSLWLLPRFLNDTTRSDCFRNERNPWREMWLYRCALFGRGLYRCTFWDDQFFPIIFSHQSFDLKSLKSTYSKSPFIWHPHKLDCPDAVVMKEISRAMSCLWKISVFFQLISYISTWFVGFLPSRCY